ncbi:MAG: hypothetical protein HKL96_12130 [Phycisphaerales bacterium]|nr:hypothetical protein [Phycisphaerales bacterium]
MAEIHLIKKSKLQGLPGIEPVSGEKDVYTSGYWTLSAERAKGLVGGEIYFHERQSEMSYFGGLILDATQQTDGQYAGKTVFKFRYLPNCRDKATSKDGWSQEMKIT